MVQYGHVENWLLLCLLLTCICLKCSQTERPTATVEKRRDVRPVLVGVHEMRLGVC